ncbi:MAG: LysR family transcriptional regulator, partial [Myxococcota bacterium]
MTVQLHRFEGFYWVAKSGGYAAAARAFPYPITQPGVHRQVRKLEEDLGHALFERVGHDRMALTRGGQVLFDYCAPFFEGLAGALEAARHPGELLRVDAGQLELSYVMPDWIRRVRAACPQLEVRLNEQADPTLDRLRAGEVELAVDHYGALPPEFEECTVATHRAFFVRPRSRRPMPETVEAMVSALAESDFVSFPEGTTYAESQRRPLLAMGLQPRVTATSSSVVGQLALVAAGLGVSLLPWPIAGGPKRTGVQCVEVPLAETRYPVQAV